jgi:ketosteroid isomerase-like protein
VVKEFLAEAIDPRTLTDAVTRLVAADAMYVSLNFDNPELRRIMPWAGTKHGRPAFVENFSGVTTRWKSEGFRITDTISEGECVALFGSFTSRSAKLGKVATSPFAVFAKVRDGRISHFQFMEDTFATALTFRSGGAWRIEADPDAAEPIEV